MREIWRFCFQALDGEQKNVKKWLLSAETQHSVYGTRHKAKGYLALSVLCWGKWKILTRYAPDSKPYHLIIMSVSGSWSYNVTKPQISNVKTMQYDTCDILWKIIRIFRMLSLFGFLFTCVICSSFFLFLKKKNI